MSNFVWLKRQCAADPRRAIFIHEICEGVDKALAAERAGYSGGRSDDPKLRRKRYLTTASSILNKPAVKLLREAYELRKAKGEQTEVVSRAERRQVLSEIARSATPNEKRQAITALNAMDREDLDHREDGAHLKASARSRIQQAVARHGEDKVVEALTVLGYQHLEFWPEVFADRLATLERRAAETGDDNGRTTEPVPRSPGVGARDSSHGGLSRGGGEASQKMARGSPVAGSAVGRGRREPDAPERNAPKRDEVSPEDAEAAAEFQRRIGLG